LQWEESIIQNLGIIIPIEPCNDKYEIFRLNFDGYCHKLEFILNLWKCGDLSLIGKITILKYLVLPKLIYKLAILPPVKFFPFLKISESTRVCFSLGF